MIVTSFADDLVSLYAYNTWANARVLDSLRALTEAEYAKHARQGVRMAGRPR